MKTRFADISLMGNPDREEGAGVSPGNVMAAREGGVYL